VKKARHCQILLAVTSIRWEREVKEVKEELERIVPLKLPQSLSMQLIEVKMHLTIDSETKRGLYTL
jgi:hypothetical protein